MYLLVGGSEYPLFTSAWYNTPLLSICNSGSFYKYKTKEECRIQHVVFQVNIKTDCLSGKNSERFAIETWICMLELFRIFRSCHRTFSLNVSGDIGSGFFHASFLFFSCFPTDCKEAAQSHWWLQESSWPYQATSLSQAHHPHAPVSDQESTRHPRDRRYEHGQWDVDFWGLIMQSDGLQTLICFGTAE